MLESSNSQFSANDEVGENAIFTYVCVQWEFFKKRCLLAYFEDGTWQNKWKNDLGTSFTVISLQSKFQFQFCKLCIDCSLAHHFVSLNASFIFYYDIISLSMLAHKKLQELNKDLIVKHYTYKCHAHVNSTLKLHRTWKNTYFLGKKSLSRTIYNSFPRL